MISFCQDLSISYEYHIYENKTIKRITHKRNGSNISQKTFIKSSKLSLVSKKIPQSKTSHPHTGISRVQNNKNLSQDVKNQIKHKRSFSTQLEPLMNQNLTHKAQQYEICQKQISFLEPRQTRSIQLHQVPFQPRVYFNRPQNISYLNLQDKSQILLNQSPTLPSKSFVQSVKFSHSNISPFKNKQSQQSKTMKINQSIGRLDESVQTKKYKDFEKNNKIQNHSCTNSFASYQTNLKMNLPNITSSVIQQQRWKQKTLNKPEKKNFFTSKQIQYKDSFRNKLMNPQHSQILQKQKNSQWYLNEIPQQKIMIFQDSLHMQNGHNQNSILFDAASIVSKNINDQQFDDQSLSIVEQRNFFFEKQDDPDHAFKKSIQKFIFFESGHISQNRKWILFRNVQQKDNKKIYSIKQFSLQHQKQYFNEYEAYLSLKTETSHAISNSNDIKNVFLHLLNALSNNSEKKLHLVKESFQCVLNDLIYHIKQKNTLSIDRLRVLLYQKNKIQIEVEKIFQFFVSKNITIRENESLQIEDFVVCQTVEKNKIIKFHSLYKLQINEKLNNTSKQGAQMRKLKQNKQKINEFHQKLHAEFFFE